MNRKPLLSLLILLCGLGTSFGQGWQKKLSPDLMMGITSVYENADGTISTTGWNLNGSTVRTMRLSAKGDILAKYDNDSINSSSASVRAQDGGFYVLGFGMDSITQFYIRNVIKISAAGQKVWLRTVHAYYNPGGRGVQGNMDVDTTDDGGLICMLNAYDSAVQRDRIYVKRLDAGGTILWERSYFDTVSTENKVGYHVRNSGDGGFLLAASMTTGRDFRVLKLDANGNVLWQYIPTVPNAYLNTKQSLDGNVLITGSCSDSINSVTRPFIGKLSQTGTVLWLHQYPVLKDSLAPGAIMEKPGDVFYCVTARLLSKRQFGFAKLDAAGNILMQNSIPLAYYGINPKLYPNSYRAFSPTADGGCLFGGWINDEATPYTAYLMKMDSNGLIYPHTLSGKTFSDNNSNCIQGDNEANIRGTIVSFSNATDTFTVMANDSGYYNLGLNGGNYNVKVKPISPYWVPVACNATMVNVTSVDTTISFGLNPAVNFPYINIDAQMRNRLCMPNVYTGEYCNNGTASFQGRIEVEMDTILQFDSASLAWQVIEPGKYVFDSVSLGMFECKKFYIYYRVPCDIDLMNRTLCVNTHAYADTIIPQSSGWDESNLQLKVNYDPNNDTIQFTVKNIGKGTMSTPQGLVVIEDNVILLKTPVQLSPSAEFYQFIKANGSTWRATIQQTRDNPYSSFATAVIEGAGEDAQGSISKKYVNQFPNNGAYAFDYTLCQPVVNSFDPNHKSVMPEGVGDGHLVESSTELEYTIDFQNTGTDTAYLVRIIDTLESYLDPATIRPGISSHAYEMEFLASNVVAFNFYNINLVDSGHSEPASNGFVKFKIRQVLGNTAGTVINNDAAIYFDYNPAIITNQATVAIAALGITGIENLYQEKQVFISAWPNPFMDKTIIKIEGERFGQLQLSVYDLTGRLVKEQRTESTNQFMLDRSGFSSGSYIFQITSKGKLVGRGKIIAD